MLGSPGRRPRVFLALMLVGPLLLSGPARADLEFEADLMATVQSLESEFDGVSNDESPGFGTTRANLHVYGEITRRMDAYLEFHLSPPNLDSEVRLDEAHLVWSYGEVLHLKLGQFEIDYGHQHRLRTDNARTENNAFVTNGLVDPHAVQTGVEVSGRLADRELAWSVGVTDGLGEDGSSFHEEAETALVGKVWGYPIEDMSVAVSRYRVNQSRFPGASNLLADTRFAVIEGINPDNVAPPLPLGREFITGEALGAGQDVTAWQLDGNYHLTGDLEAIRGWVGTLQDGDVNGPVPGEPTTESDYVGLEARVALSPATYAAGRWERLFPDVVAGSSTSGEPEMFSLAVGYTPSQHALVKLEWLRMDRDGLGGIEARIQGGILAVSGRF